MPVEHDVTEAAVVAAGVVSDEVVEAVVSDAAAGGVDLLGPDGVLAELTKRILERALEQVRFVGGFHTGRLAALQFPEYQGQSLGEPSDGVEPVQDMTGSGKITMNSCPVGVGTVGDHSLHTVAPSGSLFNEKPAQRCFRPFWEHGQHLPGVTVDDAAAGGVDLLGPDGVLAELTKRILERALEQVRFVGGFHTGRLAALQFPEYQGQSLGEPSDGVEPVQDMTGSGKITMNSCPVGVGTVGDHSLHTVAPSGSLFNEKPAQRCFRPFWEHGQHLPGVTVDDPVT